MKCNPTNDDLQSDWLLLQTERVLLVGKSWKTHVGFCVLLKFFQKEGRFPASTKEVPLTAVQFIAQQLDSGKEDWEEYPWDGATIKRHRAEIREWCGYREATSNDKMALGGWLVAEILPQEDREERLREALFQQCRRQRLEPPVTEQIRRLIQSAFTEHESRFCNTVTSKLPPATLERLDTILQFQAVDEGEWTTWQTLKSDPGKAGIDSIKEAVARLRAVREIGLPAVLFHGVPQKLLERYAKRASVEEPFELRRHIAPLRATLMAAYLRRRGEELTDHLVDLLIETVHKMGKKAEKRIDDGLGEALLKASNKMAALYRIAKASVETPQGVVSDVIFPEAPEQWLLALIKEVEASAGYTDKVKAALQKSYRHHYRRMLPLLLTNLEFRCVNTQHQPLLGAMELVTSLLEDKKTIFSQDVEVPIKGIVPPSWMPLVVEDGTINRAAYEICVLKALREQLRCREIWVVGSRRYRDPEEDLPHDFEERKSSYYEDLGIPLDPKTFTASLRAELTLHLNNLNQSMPANPKVKILPIKDGYKISVTPFEPLSEPENLATLKKEITQRWPATSLLDILKEADLRANFTQFIQSGTERSHMDKATLRRRILLCMFGMGTNTGIKSMESLPEDDYKNLLYIRRRFISNEGLRQAIAQVVNATLKIRLPQIWGEATTACAADSKQFGAWDQNLLTEWHLRYGGRGVMIYWHVEKNSACIYSQFKKGSLQKTEKIVR